MSNCPIALNFCSLNRTPRSGEYGSYCQIGASKGKYNQIRENKAK